MYLYNIDDVRFVLPCHILLGLSIKALYDCILVMLPDLLRCCQCNSTAILGSFQYPVAYMPNEGTSQCKCEKQ